MPFSIGWHQQGKVIASQFRGAVTLEEMRESSNTAIAMFAEGTPPIHFITDMSQIKSFSTNFMEIRRALVYLDHPAMGWHAFYAAPPLSTSFINVYTQVIKVRVKTFKTYEQAITFLAEQDPSVTV